MRLGSHLSISKGFDQAVLAANEICANTFQFFTRNPRGGAARNITAEEIIRWQELRNEHDVVPVLGHLPYTVNMASPVEKAHDFARMVLADDLKRMDRAGVEYMVVHPGSHAGAGREEGLRRIVQCLEEALAHFRGETVLLLETMSLQGSEIGSLEDIREIFYRLGMPEGLGVCLDTCHLTGAGYDFLRAEEVSRLLDDLERTVGIGNVKAVHLNDSKYPPGAKKDRHACIGQGYLGRQGVLNFILEPAIARLPIVLETPVENYLGYRDEILLIRQWLKEG